MSNIKERIKELRKEGNLTQEELAKLLGLSAKSNIANYENGANSPSDKVKLKMCEIFNCSMDYLTGKSDTRNEDDLFERFDNIVKQLYYDEYFNKLARAGLSYNDAADLLDIYITTPKELNSNSSMRELVMKRK